MLPRDTLDDFVNATSSSIRTLSISRSPLFVWRLTWINTLSPEADGVNEATLNSAAVGREPPDVCHLLASQE